MTSISAHCAISTWRVPIRWGAADSRQLGKRVGVSVFGTDFATPDGTGVRDYIHVSDLAAAHVLALEHLIAHDRQSHILNCGYGRGFSVLEVLDMVSRVAGQPIARNLEGRRAGDPDMLVSDSRAIASRFGWTPMHDDLETIVRDALKWERSLSGARPGDLLPGDWIIGR
jgi:UDP-glucose 4-epimerase